MSMFALEKMALWYNVFCSYTWLHVFFQILGSSFTGTLCTPLVVCQVESFRAKYASISWAGVISLYSQIRNNGGGAFYLQSTICWRYFFETTTSNVYIVYLEEVSFHLFREVNHYCSQHNISALACWAYPFGSDTYSLSPLRYARCVIFIYSETWSTASYSEMLARNAHVI